MFSKVLCCTGLASGFKGVDPLDDLFPLKR
jgi:hypothetical protein